MKNKKAIVLMATVALLLTFSTNIYSQGCHGGGSSSSHNSGSAQSSKTIPAPHGGEIKQVGKYLVEMAYMPLLAQDPLLFYLTTKKGKPVTETNISANAEFTYDDGSTETVSLEARGENTFSAPLKTKTTGFVCSITFNIKGENITARFQTAKASDNLPAKTIYTCSMHPEVQSDKPGSCLKCGMALVKK